MKVIPREQASELCKNLEFFFIFKFQSWWWMQWKNVVHQRNGSSKTSFVIIIMSHKQWLIINDLLSLSVTVEKPKKTRNSELFLTNPTYSKIVDKLVNHTVFADLYLKSDRQRKFWIEFGKPAFTLGMIKNTFFRVKKS